MIKINYELIKEVAKKVKEIYPNTVDTFTNPEYYPPEKTEKEFVARYFIFMVSIDHRLSRPGKPFEGFINGKLYHGADALYKLGMKKFNENFDFFSPKNMAKISEKEVKEWLSITDRKGERVHVWDLKTRTLLLKDLGIKLLKYYNGEVLNLINKANNYIKRGKGGLVNLLKVFKAYEDPVEKKSYLLIKFLSRRGIFNYIDKENEEVPVDNHLTRIAIRLGLIELPERLIYKIKKNEVFAYEEDVEIRLAVRKAFKNVALKSGISPLLLDDFLWMFGRKCCVREMPSCLVKCSSDCKKYGWCGSEVCVLADVCRAFRLSKYMLPEHNFINTWYY